MTRDELLAAAREAALRAHCPYSHFRVGAALLAGDKLYTGANIEISSYGLTLCAERSALAAALSAGAGPITHVAVACIDIPPLPRSTSAHPVAPAANGWPILHPRLP